MVQERRPPPLQERVHQPRLPVDGHRRQLLLPLDLKEARRLQCVT